MPRAGEQHTLDREPTDDELERLRQHLVKACPAMEEAAVARSTPPADETPLRRYTREMCERNQMTPSERAALPPIHVPDEARGSGC